MQKHYLSIVKQFNQKRCELEIEYSRAVNYDGNLAAQKLNDKYFRRTEQH